jgi:hypothetical protein
MTAPGPIAGANPHVGTYQTKQFDTSWPPAETPLHALDDPPVTPAAGSFAGSNAIASSSSPDKAFAAAAAQNARATTGIP